MAHWFAAVSLGACAASPATTTTTTPGGSGGAGGAGGGQVVEVGAGPWPVTTSGAAPVPLDDVTVFAYSQVNADSAADPQVVDLAPDLSIRAWNQWDTSGTSAADFNASDVAACHAANVRFMGGLVPTVIFRDQFATEAEFEDFQTRDAAGHLVSHDVIVPGLRRATLANPAVRDYIVKLGKIQIDAGVDGLHFDEVNGDYQGAAFDDNEGFDDYHIADFNAYLLAKYPAGTDFAARFQMSADNVLRADLPPGDLTGNFDYRRYLASHGWTTNPLSALNPLAAEWGHAVGNRIAPGAPTFVDAAEPHRYWKQIVTELRDYARTRNGRDLLISGNGVLPYVDFQTIGLYYPNNDGANGGAFAYENMTADGHLDATVSWQPVLRRLKAQAEALAPGAPVSLFMDGHWNVYDALPAAERQDFWRIYSAEAYANGLFLAFQLLPQSGSPQEPTATQAGVMPLYHQLAAFYRAHADLYHGVAASDAAATVSLAHAMVAVADQRASADATSPLQRRLVHVVNHTYRAGIVAQTNVSLSVRSDAAAPVSATLLSPDLAAPVALDFTYSDGAVSLVVPTLVAYDVVVLGY